MFKDNKRSMIPSSSAFIVTFEYISVSSIVPIVDFEHVNVCWLTVLIRD